mgnify:CR=1 FL=1
MWWVSLLKTSRFNIPDLLDDMPKHLSNGRSRCHTESLSQATFSRWSGILSHQFHRVILSNVHHCLWGKYCAINLISSIISSTKHQWHDAAQRYLKFHQTDRQAYSSSDRMSKFNLGKFTWYGVSIAWVNASCRPNRSQKCMAWNALLAWENISISAKTKVYRADKDTTRLLTILRRESSKYVRVNLIYLWSVTFHY